MKKKLIIIIPVLIAAIAFFFVYRYYNKEDKTTTLTVNEKRWVQNNKEETYDFEVVNDYPLYGLNGTGVIFDFIDDFEKNIGIEFNKISFMLQFVNIGIIILPFRNILCFPIRGINIISGYTFFCKIIWVFSPS